MPSHDDIVRQVLFIKWKAYGRSSLRNQNDEDGPSIMVIYRSWKFHVLLGIRQLKPSEFTPALSNAAVCAVGTRANTG
jgi:hypothetical protein